MRKNSVAMTFAVLLSCIHSYTVYSQNNEASYYNWFDGLVGVENTALYNGIMYVEQYRTVNDKTKFFKSPYFLPGSITYYGQDFYGLELKYDVFEDQLLMKIQDRLGGSTLQLFNEEITAFVIDGHEFVKIEGMDATETEIQGFHEISLVSPLFTFYLKHKKKDFDRKDRRTLYYEFIDSKSGYVLLYNDILYVIRNKKDVTTIFPELKKEVDTFYNVAKSLRSSNPDAFMKSLMKRIEILLLQENNRIEE